jgi:hypothetical protein
MKEPMRPARRHGNPTLQKTGLVVMFAGAVLFLLPAPPADPFATTHELIEMTARHYLWQWAGICVYVVGNTLRLIGKQGHPGLPWPVMGPPIEVVASIQLRRRAWENRVKALSAPPAPPTPRRRRFKLAFARIRRMRRGRPQLVRSRRRRAEAPAFAN